MQGENIFIRGVIQWLGFKQAYVEYSLQKREHGKSKFTLKKMLELASSGIRAGSIVALRLSLFIGIIFAGLAFLYCIYALYASLFTNWVITGWTSVIVSVLLLSGIQLIVLGIIGEYLGKLFVESKKHPNYIIDETTINSKGVRLHKTNI